FYGRIGRLGTLEDLINQCRGPREVMRDVGTVSHEAAGLRVFAFRKHSRQTAFRRELGDASAIAQEYAVANNDECRGASPRQGFEDGVEMGCPSYGDEVELQAE